MPDSLFNNVTLLIKGTSYDDNQIRDHSKFYMAEASTQGGVSESSVVLQWDPQWADTSIFMPGTPPAQINVPLCPVNGVPSRTFPATGYHTHEMFVNCEGWGNYALASCCDQGLTNGWVLSLTSNGNVRFRTFGYGNDLTITTDWEFQPWTWQHIAVIRTTQGGRFGFRLMVDRQMTPFVEDSLANPYVPYTATPLVIGAAGSMSRMNGNLCQYRITDGAERYATPPPASIYTTAFPGRDDWPASPAFTPPASPTGLVGWGVGWGAIDSAHALRENSPIDATYGQAPYTSADMCFGPTGPFTTFTWSVVWSAGAMPNPFANPSSIVADSSGARIVSIDDTDFPSAPGQTATISTFYNGQPSNTLTIRKDGSGLHLTSETFTPPPPVVPPPAPKALYTWGENTSGEAGVGTLVDVLSPTQITGSWIDLSMGSAHSLAVRADGTLWAWGENFSSQCGQSGVDRFSFPVQVGTDTDWTKVAAGNGFSIALKANGAMYGFGSPASGNMAQLPGGPTPALIHAGPWASVATGSDRTTGIRTNGTLWSTGFNSSGQLGVGDFTSKWVLTQESRAYTNWSKVVSRQPSYGATFALRVGGALYYTGNPDLDGAPTSIQDGMFTLAAAGPWLDVQVNGTNAIGVKTDGTLWTWGNNVLGVLGTGNTTSALAAPAQIGTATNWVGVAMGDWNAAAYNSLGEVFVWGNGSKGGIGNGLTANNLTPTLVNGPWIGTGTVAGVFVSERGTVGVLTTLPTIDPPDPEPPTLPTTTPRFNTEFRYGLSGGPGFSTTVVTSVSGHESSNSHWSIPLGKWTTGPDLYTRLELVDIYNFFMICRGQAQAFRFKAWEDFEASGNEGRVSLTATANTLQLFKRYQVVAAVVDVPIHKPVPVGFQLWAEDPVTFVRTLLVRTIDYNIDFETGLITGRTNADAPNLRWTGTFDKWAKFTTDHLPCEFVNFREDDGERLFSISGLGIREIRPT